MYHSPEGRGSDKGKTNIYCRPSLDPMYMYVYMCVYVYMYMCVYVYMYMCIYVYMRMCVYCMYVNKPKPKLVSPVVSHVYVGSTHAEISTFTFSAFMRTLHDYFFYI